MKRASILFTLSVMLTLAPSLWSQPGREKLLLDFDWKFSLGHGSDPVKDFSYGLGTAFAKAGEAYGAAAPNFNDSSWRTIDLPHDWVVELPFVNSPDADVKAHGYKPIGRQFPETTIGWYRRSFSIPVGDRGRRIAVQFDGVFRDATVWFNGHYLGRHPGGYSPFSYDLTSYVRYGQRNTLVVRVDASQFEGWFYEGAGIYRHVWLLKYQPLHIAAYGVFAHSRIEGNQAYVTVETTVENESATLGSGQMAVTLIDPFGQVAGKSTKKFADLPPRARSTLSHKITVNRAKLWSLESPQLYTVRTQVISEGIPVDALDTRIGLRSIWFDADHGFFLNGQPVKIQGVCCHQDHAGVGAALPDGLQEFRIKRLKEMGCNAYRTSHNPPTPELLEACDRLGMLVMDENRLMGSSPERLDELETLIKRDRNHPSVIMWSIGNEEYVIQGNETGRQVALDMMAHIQSFDATRAITYGANIGPDATGINSVIPVRGFNYKRIGGIDRYRQLHPDQPLIGSEEGSTVCTRGFYRNDTLKGYVCDYDSMYPSWASTAKDWWGFYAERSWLSGGFVWTGFDYRGEPTPYGWPCINSHFGIMDMCGFAKNNFFYYQAWWSRGDVLHIFPHWNWPGREGERIDVWCHSNCDSVELFLNGQTLGRQKMARNDHLIWPAVYAPGVLEARGWRQGRQLTRKIETTGPAVKIALIPDKSELKADREDICLITVLAQDSQGREVPPADHVIRFDISGPGRIIGVGNGDPSSHEPDKCMSQPWERRLFSGKCQVIVQSLRVPGELFLTASSPGLAPEKIKLEAVICTPRPYVPAYQPERILHLGLHKPIAYRVRYSPRWPGAGEKTLTNGVLGSGEYFDGQWQGFEGEDFEAVIDLGAALPLHGLRVSFLQDANSWIFWPQSVYYALSSDGDTYTVTRPVNHTEDPRSIMIRTYRGACAGIPVRYIKVMAKNIGVCPPGHPGAGGKAWLFIDEIVVE